MTHENSRLADTRKCSTPVTQRSAALGRRFKSCLVDTETYVLRCYRYIELNPVRAWMVEAPTIPVVSHGSNALGISDPMLTPQLPISALGGSTESAPGAIANYSAKRCPTTPLRRSAPTCSSNAPSAGARSSNTSSIRRSDSRVFERPPAEAARLSPGAG